MNSTMKKFFLLLFLFLIGRYAIAVWRAQRAEQVWKQEDPSLVRSHDVFQLFSFPLDKNEYVLQYELSPDASEIFVVTCFHARELGEEFNKDCDANNLYLLDENGKILQSFRFQEQGLSTGNGTLYLSKDNVYYFFDFSNVVLIFDRNTEKFSSLQIFDPNKKSRPFDVKILRTNIAYNLADDVLLFTEQQPQVAVTYTLDHPKNIFPELLQMSFDILNIPLIESENGFYEGVMFFGSMVGKEEKSVDLGRYGLTFFCHKYNSFEGVCPSKGVRISDKSRPKDFVLLKSSLMSTRSERYLTKNGNLAVVGSDRVENVNSFATKKLFIFSKK